MKEKSVFAQKNIFEQLNDSIYVYPIKREI